MKINSRGFWENGNCSGHVYDLSLNDELLEFLNENKVMSVVDFGCGMGDYALNINSTINCDAYDGNPNTVELTKGLGKVLDLSIPFDLNKRYDCVISLEVGEHIPKEYEEVFINNITKHANDLLILSWAVLGQGGDGHVNCQDNDYIINQIKDKGFSFDEASSNRLRNSATVAPWFRNTILVFRKDK